MSQEQSSPGAAQWGGGEDHKDGREGGVAERGGAAVGVQGGGWAPGLRKFPKEENWDSPNIRRRRGPSSQGRPSWQGKRRESRTPVDSLLISRCSLILCQALRGKREESQQHPKSRLAPLYWCPPASMPGRVVETEEPWGQTPTLPPAQHMSQACDHLS